MSATEKRATFSLASIYALRMLGLFLIMPVFALYAEHLAGVTPLLVGLAIGIYGLTQALLQIPFGMLSDRIGRKPVIVGGLILFAIGSVVAAMSESITGVIIGRALQGSGAIAAAVMALVADSTRESSRTKAMALIGISIGMAFMIALVAGPIRAQTAQTGVIEGVVRDASGGPIEGAVALVAQADGSYSGQAVTGTDGRFRVGFRGRRLRYLFRFLLIGNLRLR